MIVTRIRKHEQLGGFIDVHNFICSTRISGVRYVYTARQICGEHPGERREQLGAKTT